MKLQRQPNGQYQVTMPKDLVIAFGWDKGTELTFKVLGKDELSIKKK